MKSSIWTAALAVAGMVAGTALASPLLLGRDITGAAVAYNDPTAVFEFDPNQNLTWLRDWNVNGNQDWFTQRDWASGLTAAVVGTFVGGWSLPGAQEYESLWNYLGGSTAGLNTYFENVVPDRYWSDTGQPGFAFAFRPLTGELVPYGTDAGSGNRFYAVAVRSGDVAAPVPAPQTLALTLLALGAAVMVRPRSG